MNLSVAIHGGSDNIVNIIGWRCLDGAAGITPRQLSSHFPQGDLRILTYPRHETAVTIARAGLTGGRWFSPMEPEPWGVFYSILVPDRGVKENICTE
jgi:hypothetical protein